MSLGAYFGGIPQNGVEVRRAMIGLVKLSAGDSCSDDELRARMLQNRKARHTHHYVAIEDDLEVAFLALDQIPDVDYLVLYEMFVRQDCRRRGIGSRLLREVEGQAAELGYKRVILNPWPLEEGFPEAQLIAWYKKHGYCERLDCPTELEKGVVG